ncbi:MAG: hypothetical protein R3B38_02650, partial [Patescibacteria group bacterium]
MELFEKDYKLEKEIDHVESGSSFEMAEDLDVLEVNTSQDNDKLAEAREMLLGLYARKAEVSKRMSESDYEWSDDSLGMQFRDAVANEPLSRDELIE